MPYLWIIESSIHIINIHILFLLKTCWLVPFLEPSIFQDFRNCYPLHKNNWQPNACIKQVNGLVKDFRWIDEFQTRTKVWELTVTGLGSRIRFISFFAPGDNHDGHEKSALQIWNLGRLCINVLDDILTIRKEEIELRST